jgi:hypothetical protein
MRHAPAGAMMTERRIGMTPEGKIKKECAEFLARVPDLVFWYSPANKPPSGRARKSRFERKTLDIVGYWKQYFFTIEIKVPNHKTEKKRLQEQIAMIEDVCAAGGFAAMVDNVADLRSRMINFSTGKNLWVP